MDLIQRLTRSSARKNQANLTQTMRDSNPRNVTRKMNRIQKLKNIAKGGNPDASQNTIKSNETTALPAYFAMAVFDESTGKMMEMRDLLRHPDPTVRKEWETSVANELGQLLICIFKTTNNGKSRVGDGHDTFHFIHKSQVPQKKKVTYARFYCDVRPKKKKKSNKNHRRR